MNDVFTFWMPEHDIEFSSKLLCYVYLLLIFGGLSSWIMLSLRRIQSNLFYIALFFSYQDSLKCRTTYAIWNCKYGCTHFKWSLLCFIVRYAAVFTDNMFLRHVTL